MTEFTVTDLDALAKAKPDFIITKVIIKPNLRKIRQALDLGFDLPGVTKGGSGSETPVSTLQGATTPAELPEFIKRATV